MTEGLSTCLDMGDDLPLGGRSRRRKQRSVKKEMEEHREEQGLLLPKEMSKGDGV